MIQNLADLQSPRILIHCPFLEGLDLSDIPTVYEDESHPWMGLLQWTFDNHDNTNVMFMFLQRLRWLGLPDFRSPPPDLTIRGPRDYAVRSPQDFATCLHVQLVPYCHNLKILSIRGKRSGDEVADAHNYVCKLPSFLAQFAPQNVTTLELRLPFPFLDELQNVLRNAGSSIKNIGIDFGAWVHDYAKQESATNALKEGSINEVASNAARKRRFEAYEEPHNQSFGVEEKWWLPKSCYDNSPVEEKSYSGDAKHAYERNFYLDDEIQNPPAFSMITDFLRESSCLWNEQEHHARLVQHLERTNTRTLSMMMDHLYQMRSTYSDLKFFALEPEWQENSNSPIHPFALVQKPHSRELLKAEGVKNTDLPTLQPKVYKWLNMTFNWRPVFDWDWLMKPGHESSGDTSTSAHERLKQQWGLDASDEKLLIEVAKHFKLMKNAGIPTHLLIGRRHLDSSSLYWGWPYNDTTWKKWLKDPFDGKLRTVAPLVDTLSVFYNLRNPLDEGRLQAIDSLSCEDSIIVPATCPRPLCPWAKEGQQCPFPHQWGQPSLTTGKQKTANQRHVKATSLNSPHLAPNIPSLPPVGHYAQESHHNTYSDEPLHEIARLAAYEREAVGWQRFWYTYATQFTELSELNVRMPKSFDGVGSVKLASLLDLAKGWSMISYADETDDVQTERDLKDGEGKRWPAGNFVRRSWIRRLLAPVSAQTGTKEAKGLHSQEHEDEVERREKEQLDKAVQRAEKATTRESVLQSNLTPKSDNGSVSIYNPATDNEGIESKLADTWTASASYCATNMADANA
jgi:hypothetical protein